MIDTDQSNTCVADSTVPRTVVTLLLTWPGSSMVRWLTLINCSTTRWYNMRMVCRLLSWVYSSKCSDFICWVPCWRLISGTPLTDTPPSHLIAKIAIDTCSRLLNEHVWPKSLRYKWPYVMSVISLSCLTCPQPTHSRCSSSLTARVLHPDNPNKVTQHSHQEIARVMAGGSLLRSSSSSLSFTPLLGAALLILTFVGQ